MTGELESWRMRGKGEREEEGEIIKIKVERLIEIERGIGAN